MHINKGFTLIELVITIVLLSIVSLMTTGIILQPIETYKKVNQLSAVSGKSDSLLSRLSSDIEMALPNSIKITNSGKTITFYKIVDGGRYRKMDGGVTDDKLDLSIEDTSFSVIGELKNFNKINLSNDQLIIYNMGHLVTGADIYLGGNYSNISPLTTKNKLNFTAKKFNYHSPNGSFFIVSDIISYNCYLGDVTRESKKVRTLISWSSLVSSGVTACHFKYSEGVSTRNNIVEVELEFKINNTQKIKVLKQIRVNNIS